MEATATTQVRIVSQLIKTPSFAFIVTRDEKPDKKGDQMEIKIFKNPQFGAIRTVETGDEPWFVGKDVAEVLGYSDTFGALKKHVDAEDKQNCRNDSFDSPRGMTIINESGLYSLILSSKLPSAKAFKRWITHEVIPSIRKTGGYIEGQEHMSDADLMAKALLVAQRQIAQRDKQLQEMQPKALFADSVCASSTSILIGELAKILKQNGVATGQNKLFAWMRDNGYLIRRKGADYNMPTQRSMEMQLFEIKETVVTHADGHTSINKTTKVTGKGQVYFVNKLCTGV